ncbi:zinc-dependent alcohol dehydrogenase [Nitratireductor indicus]|uniref:zinc-dependent alcohol dehydrogenase n=1 Tax=Nitratireductor indicus TaxID=721133 RepID=UPI0028767EBF|nr:alcohol dehydrogenase catalytic domain-containing protein [Nitratireductor indicus]MDS1137212.1 alcohol dehydrogenase catalytic domain-containing protein [Nitratireductor indicus]
MLALRKAKPAFGAELADLPVPVHPPERGSVRIRVGAAGICGSDLHAYEWTGGYQFMERLMPLTLGHEFAGTVVEAGNGVSALAIGDRVVCWPTIFCGSCVGCIAGRPEECRSRRVIGLHCDGGFAEFVDVPEANCFRLPDEVPMDVAALAEPLAVSVNAVDLAEVGPGDAVVVLGPGPIGMAAAWVAQQRGADVLLAGFKDDARLDCARRLGLIRTADLASETLDAAVARVFGREADRVIEATGHAASVSDGLSVLRPRGIVVVAGIHHEACELDLTRFVREKKQLRGAHDTTERAFREAISLLVAHGPQLAPMISLRAPLSQAEGAFEKARSRTAVKVLLLPQTPSDEDLV